MKHAPRLYDVVLEFIRQCPWSDLRHALAPSAFDLAVDATPVKVSICTSVVDWIG